MNKQTTAAGPNQYIFYIAFAHIIEVLGPTRCRLWLLNHANEKLVNTWLDSKAPKIPCSNIIVVNFDNTLENQGAVDVAPHRLGNLDLTEMGGDYPLGGDICGQVAISERLWRQLIDKPIGHAKEYQLKVIVKTQGYTPRNAYLGFRASVLEVDRTQETRKRLLFYSWTDQVLGDAWVDLTADGYCPDPTTAGCLDKFSTIGQSGAVFVSAELIGSGALYFLIGPKVPYGAGSVTTDSAGPTRRRYANPSVRPALICSEASDGWLNEARTRIRHYTPAGTREDLERGIVRLLAGNPSLPLALISHSQADRQHRHVLRFGTYDIDENAFINPNPALGHALQNREVYLVGCYTAYARDVLQSFKDRFGITAYGTSRIVGLFDLHEGGVRARRYKRLFVSLDDHPIVDVLAVIEDHLLDAGAIKHDEHGIVDEFWDGIPEGAQPYSFLLDLDILREADAYYDLPGILTVPDRSIYDSIRHLLVEVLFQAWLIRVTIRRPGALPKIGIFLLTAEQRETVQDALAQRNPSVK